MDTNDRTGLSGIQFFGKMSASISHDLKNVLAVINENAGLLEDLCLMAERGKPFDAARLNRLAADVKNQIKRGDRIITTLNRFAHSGDSDSVTADLRELLELLVELSLRYASMRGVSLKMAPAADAATITTSPFVLLNLLWHCLDYAMAAAGTGKAVELTAEKANEGARLRFRKLEALAEAAGPFPSEQENALGRALRAQIRVDAGSHEIVVSLPAQA
jgi:C4-dicarboxylate-specific signal transduction histidine kinase